QRALALGSQLEQNLSVETHCADSEEAIPSLLGKLGGGVPTFVNVDPYGHPLSLSVLNQILRRPQTELMINLMWYQINRDLNNPSERARIDRLFGDVAWQGQPFMSDRGQSREAAFLEFFKSRLQARFVLEFKIRFDPEDLTRGDRTKYYLIHACNHIKAVNLMKSVMWPLGDEEGTFDYSGSSQGILISETPTEIELREILLRTFCGQTKTFDQIVQQTWQLPFLEKHYRNVLKSMEGNEVTVTRISSKRTGITGNDQIHFPEAHAIA
ncbi:MAG TPA: three-Cys-motif partner protein TcmP, partial [Candidatus Acidoferrales bacterium]|nr:three-Cys-motif partner protein TcmP [Candidatus Acidoferrales bacterium]